MASQMVASAAAASSDPAWTYPAVKPAAAASVPHTSASPNRSRHARHHPAGRSGTGDALIASALPAVTAASPMESPLIAPPRFPPRRVAARFLIHLHADDHVAFTSLAAARQVVSSHASPAGANRGEPRASSWTVTPRFPRV